MTITPMQKLAELSLVYQLSSQCLEDKPQWTAFSTSKKAFKEQFKTYLSSYQGSPEALKNAVTLQFDQNSKAAKKASKIANKALRQKPGYVAPFPQASTEEVLLPQQLTQAGKAFNDNFDLLKKAKIHEYILFSESKKAIKNFVKENRDPITALSAQWKILNNQITTLKDKIETSDNKEEKAVLQNELTLQVIQKNEFLRPFKINEKTAQKILAYFPEKLLGLK